MAITSLGYFLGWLLGFLAAIVTLSVAKEVLVVGLSFFVANKIVTWYQDRKDGIVEVDATEIPMDAKFAS
jgi:hypothetical protein